MYVCEQCKSRYFAMCLPSQLFTECSSIHDVWHTVSHLSDLQPAAACSIFIMVMGNAISRILAIVLREILFPSHSKTCGCHQSGRPCGSITCPPVAAALFRRLQAYVGPLFPFFAPTFKIKATYKISLFGYIQVGPEAFGSCPISLQILA